ncbi:MAG TPA: hypothetical protein VKA38_04400 [Draconibacterium sp.]|nr:hypothetical protein [Draconibacterium sp.]
MNTDLKQFIAKTVGISAAIALVGWIVFSLFVPQYYLPVLPFALAFFLLFTILIHAYQLKMAKKDLGKFTRSSMLVTFLKLTIYSIFGVVYIASDSENAITFIICLMLLYIIFSFIEVVELTRVSKKIKNK